VFPLRKQLRDLGNGNEQSSASLDERELKGKR